jgi:hypothetical protein
VYVPITQDIIVAGSGAVAFQKHATVTTQDIIVTGRGTYVLFRGYHGSGGVIVGGSYWTFGQVIRFCGTALEVPHFADMTFDVAGLSNIACGVPQDIDHAAEIAGLDSIAFDTPRLASMVFYGAESCPPMTAAPGPAGNLLTQEDGSAILLEDGSGSLETEA